MKYFSILLLFIIPFEGDVQCQLIDLNFENWQDNGVFQLPQNWSIDLEACVNENNGDFFKATDSYEGNYSLRMRSICGTPCLYKPDLYQIIDMEGKILPQSVKFVYKMKNVETQCTPEKAGCGIISVITRYNEGGQDYNSWGIWTEEDINEWTQGELMFEFVDTTKTIDYLFIKITGGSCDNGVGNIGNCDFLLDSFTETLTSQNSLNTSEINIYPNPVKDYLTVENVENCQISIFNLSGEMMMSYKEKKDPIQRINLLNIEEKLILVKITNTFTNKTHVKKIIKYSD